MNNKDVLDILKRTYSDDAPDILHNLTFDGVEKEEIKLIPVRKKYFTAAAIYAAACLVVAISLPFLIGRGEDPAPNPGVSVYKTETAVTGDSTHEDRIFTKYDSETVTVTETDEITESVESVTSNETTNPEETASNDVYPTPVESSEEIIEPESETVAPERPEPEPEPEKKPTIAVPMVSSTKYTSESKPEGPTPVVTTPVVTTPEVTAPAITTPAETTRPSNGLEPGGIVYHDPATAARLRFFKDKDLTEEYESYYDIPYGEMVFYRIESDPGYICTNIKMNKYEFHQDKVWENGDSVPTYYNYFINNYSFEGLEYNLTTVLAGDSDQNLVYNLKDAATMLKYIAKYPVVKNEFDLNGNIARLDYNCDGRANMLDVASVLKEIAGWDVKRTTVSEYDYSNRDLFSITHLLPMDGTEIFSHELTMNQMHEAGYAVFRTVGGLRDMPEEMKNKYDSVFFDSYDLVVIYCGNPDGTVPAVNELWHNTATGYVTPVFDDPDTEYFGEYAICIPVIKSRNVKQIDPK